MTNSVYEFWLSYNNGKEKLRLPVLPESLNIGYPSRNESVMIANLGEVTIIQDSAATTFSFSSFFPKVSSPLVEYVNPPQPWECVEILKKWRKTKKPIRFIVTNTPINYAVSIEGFSHDEVGGAVGDLNYELMLKEYNFVKNRKIEIKQQKPQPKKTIRPSTVEKVKTYQVRSGDTLWDIARKASTYGNSADWKKLWNANKDMLIKRDKRNVSQPGHWIYAGQVLKVP